MVTQRERLEQIRQKNWETTDDKLTCEALEYEEKYFEDMTLEDESIRDSFKVTFEKDGKDVGGSWGEPPYVTLGDGWKFVEKRLRKWDGRCRGKRFKVEIKQGLFEEERKITLLHEMIHAYERELVWVEGVGGKMRELLYIVLYKKLISTAGQEKMDELLRIAVSSLFWESGHSILFTLKALDLDIRLKLPYGSIFGYGKTEWF